MRRPYRVYLPSRLRRVSFATATRAVAACEADGPGIYVVEHRVPEGPYLPMLIVRVGDSRTVQERWEHLRSREVVA